MGLLEQFRGAVDALAAAGDNAAGAIADAAAQGATTVADAGTKVANEVADAGEGTGGAIAAEADAAANLISAAGRRAANVIADEGRRAADLVASEARRLADGVAAEIRRDQLSVDSIGESNARDRHMTDDEVAVARTVFGDSIPYDRVWISPRGGLGGHPYTVPNPDLTSYVICLGRLFRNSTSRTDWTTNLNGDTHFIAATLIHELTHVWQGEHWRHTGDYVVDAAAHLVGVPLRNPYAYRLGLRWEQYYAEQQATIVEDWFAVPGTSDSTGDSASTDSPRFPFIRDNIRRGVNDPTHPRNALS